MLQWTKKDERLLVTGGLILVLLAMAAGIIYYYIAVQPDKATNENQGALGGLLNHEQLSDPVPVTKNDLEEEYNDREEMTETTEDMLNSTITQYLNRGDFAGLDAFLAEQSFMHKNATGDDAQNMEDWASLFELYRGDLTTTLNLTTDNATQSLSCYASPEILAATIAYSPISVKEDAFVDWSAILLPAVTASDSAAIGLRAVEIDNSSDMLDEINHNSTIRYTDLVAYDMTLYGYKFRFYALGDDNGYYRPYSLMNTDGFGVDLPDRTEVKEIEQHLAPGDSIDGVISITSFDVDAYLKAKEDHPELFATSSATNAP